MRTRLFSGYFLELSATVQKDGPSWKPDHLEALISLGWSGYTVILGARLKSEDNRHIHGRHMCLSKLHSSIGL